MFSAREEVSDWSDADSESQDQPQTLLGKISSIFGTRSALTDLAVLSPRTSPRATGAEIPPLHVLSGMSGVSQRVPFPVLTRPACKWGDSDVSNFAIRGKNYMRDKRKMPAPQPLYQLLGADLFSFERKIPHVAEHIALPPAPRLGPRASLSPLSPLLIVNFQLPDYAPSMLGGASDGSGRFLVLYFALPEGWEPPEDGRTKIWTPTALGFRSAKASSRAASRPPIPPPSEGRRGRRRGRGIPSPSSGLSLPATPEVPPAAEASGPSPSSAVDASAAISRLGAEAPGSSPCPTVEAPNLSPRPATAATGDVAPARSAVMLRLSTDESYQSPFNVGVARKRDETVDAVAETPNGLGGAHSLDAGATREERAAPAAAAVETSARSGSRHAAAQALQTSPFGAGNGELPSPTAPAPAGPDVAAASLAKTPSAGGSTEAATEVGSCEPTPRPLMRVPTTASEATSVACSTSPAHAAGGAPVVAAARGVAAVPVVRAEATPSLAITERLFSNGTEQDGKPTRDRLKLIPHVNDVAGWAKRAPLSRTEHNLLVRYNNKPVLTRPQHAFYRGKNYVEIDLDVHSYAYLARRALHGFRSRIHTIDVDLALVVQGNSPDELPEGLLCAARIFDLDWNGAQGFVKVGDGGADGRSGHVASAQPRPLHGA